MLRSRHWKCTNDPQRDGRPTPKSQEMQNSRWNFGGSTGLCWR